MRTPTGCLNVTIPVTNTSDVKHMMIALGSRLLGIWYTQTKESMADVRVFHLGRCARGEMELHTYDDQSSKLFGGICQVVITLLYIGGKSGVIY